MSTEFDADKFRELVLFVASESADDPRFGATKLNKILYFSDFKAFGILGESITGATYQRLDHGPAPVELLPELRRMEAEGDMERIERRYFNLRQKIVRALRLPDLERFRAEELEIVRNVIAELRDLDATQVRALSHLEAGWRRAYDREVIPYETVFVSDRRPTPRELALWEQDVARRRAHRSAS